MASSASDQHIQLETDFETQQPDVSKESQKESAVRKVLLKLPAQIGNQNITTPEQLVELLNARKNVQMLKQDVKELSKQKVVGDSLTKSGEEYKCAQCEYTSHNKHYLKQHFELVHLAERPYKCPFCDYAGKRSHSLKEHLVVHSSYRPYECHFCNASFRKKGHLTNHIKLHASISHSAQEYNCKVCSETFKEAVDFWNHLRQVHFSDELYFCDRCPFATLEAGEYKVHECFPGKDKLHSCTACDFVCERELDMMSHIADMHQGKASCTVLMAQTKPNSGPSRNSAVVLLKCTECGFTSADKDVLMEHMVVHLNEEERTKLLGQQDEEKVKKAYECECGHLALSEPLMLEHVQQAHGVEGTENQTSTTVLMLKCAECGYTASDNTTMQAHMIKHLEQLGAKTSQASTTPGADVKATTLYNCAQCNFSSKEAYVFITHMLTHRPAMKTSSRQSGSPRGGSSPAQQPAAQLEADTTANQGYVHDMAMGVYRCAICSYSSEHQRIIKAHIWKHSGHKDIDYPMFQNGPLSMFDYTPIGATKLTSSKSVIAEPKPVKTPPHLTAKPDDIEETGDGKAVQQKTIVSAKAIVDGNSKQVILVPATSMQQERAALLQVNNAVRNLNQAEKPAPVVLANQALKGLLGSRKEVVLAPHQVRNSPEGVVVVMEAGDRKRMHQGKGTEEEEENLVPVPVKKAFIEVKAQSPAHVVVEPMYPKEQVLELVRPLSQSSSPQPPQPEACELTPEEMQTPSSEQEEEGPQEVAVEMEVIEESEVAEMEAECPMVEEGGCVEVYTSQDDSTSSTVSDVQVDDDEEGDLSREEVEDITREQALTLLSLLKKGPNYNPACPPSEKLVPSVDSHNKARILDHSYRGRKANMKSGISDSLLAAIEHLRQGENSEDPDLEVNSRGKHKRGAGKAAKGTRRSRRKAAQNDTTSPIDSNHNVEMLARNRMRCKLCHYTTTSGVLMRSHLRVHKAKTSGECSLCDFVSEDSEQLQQHMLQHCKVRTYQCKYCSSEFSYKSQLRAHMRAHDESHPLICEQCDFQTWNLMDYQQHLPCRTLRTQCSQCEVKFGSPAELEAHLAASKCNAEGALKCDQCSYSTDSQENFNKHVRWHGRTYKCDQCDFVCTNYKGMANHSRVHFEEKDQKCEFCDFVAKSVRSLKSHMKRHANDQRFVQQPLEQYMCNLCGYVCHHLPSLKSHMWRHASDTNYSYTVTNQVINAALDWDSTSSNVNKNTSNQEDDIQREEAAPQSNSLITFCCCQCGFESTDKGVLNNHMKIHNDIIQKTLAVNMGRFAIQTPVNVVSGEENRAAESLMTAHAETELAS